MTVDIWTQIEKLSLDIEDKFSGSGTKVPEPTSEYDWYNAIYTSKKYRRAHIEIVDRRASHKIFIVHCTIFPHVTDPSPIWGFDVVCGPSKITGAFHDFSLPSTTAHPMFMWWKSKSEEYSWHKPRSLPKWAQHIFSKYMIAAGNINTQTELDALCSLVISSLTYYLDNVGEDFTANNKALQNFYCQQQKLNPHVVRSMVAMGVPELVIKQFVNQVLFPELT